MYTGSGYFKSFRYSEAFFIFTGTASIANIFVLPKFCWELSGDKRRRNTSPFAVLPPRS